MSSFKKAFNSDFFVIIPQKAAFSNPAAFSRRDFCARINKIIKVNCALCAVKYKEAIMANSIFKDKTLLITGGTGSFGHTVLKHFLSTDIGEIRIFSRDEKKQDDMRHELQAQLPGVRRARSSSTSAMCATRSPSVESAMPGVDYIFHAAALKQVPSCEFFPMQAVQHEHHRHRQRAAPPPSTRALSVSSACPPTRPPTPSTPWASPRPWMEHVIFGQRPRGGRARRHDHLLHPLRQRHVQPRQRDSAVHRPDQEQATPSPSPTPT